MLTSCESVNTEKARDSIGTGTRCGL